MGAAIAILLILVITVPAYASTRTVLETGFAKQKDRDVNVDGFVEARAVP